MSIMPDEEIMIVASVIVVSTAAIAIHDIYLTIGSIEIVMYFHMFQEAIAILYNRYAEWWC